MAGGLVWNGAAIFMAVHKLATKNAFHAGGFVRRGIQKSLSTSNQRGTSRSKPGEAPRRMNGKLARNVIFKVKKSPLKISVRVGVTKQMDWVAQRLEFGSQDVEQRPFLRPFVIHNRRAIGAVMAGVKLGRRPKV